MSKFRKLVQALRILIRKPYLLNKVIDDPSVYKEQIDRYHGKYTNGLPVIELTEILPRFSEKLDNISYLNGGSLVTDLALLKGLAKNYKNCTYFEIGTWRGESATNIANETEKCYTLNLSNNELKKLGYNEEYLNQQGFFSKGVKKVTHLHGNSSTFDFTPYYGKCDLIFIDGDHCYDSIVQDTKTAFKLMKDDSSTIVWHDYNLQPGIVRWDVLKGILDGSLSEDHQRLFSISNTLCAIYTRRTYNVINTESMTPTKKFEVNIKSTPL